MRNRRLSLGAAILFTLQILLISPASAANTLGIGVDVLPASGSSQTKASMGADGSLWFIIPPGKSGSRSIRVYSVAGVAMKISASVGYGVYRNGEANFDESKETELSQWARFDSSAFSLQPRASKVITIKFDVPESTKIGTNLATVFITGTPLAAVKSQGTFSVPGAARVAIPVFLGVGTAAQIAVNFKIKKLSIKNDNGNRYAIINIANTGQTPVSPSGYIRVAGYQGGIKIDNPIKIQSSTIVPGESRDLIVLVPEFIPNGKWVFMTELQQGPIQQTAEATVSLTAPSIFTINNFLRAFFFLIFALIFYFSARYLRNRGPMSEGHLPPEKFIWPPKFLLIFKKQSREEEAVEDHEYLEIIAQINARIAREAKAPVKKAAKKAPAKKAPAKKTPAKKAPAKKAAKKVSR